MVTGEAVAEGAGGVCKLGAERNLLRNHGWTFDKSTGLWNPWKGGG